MSSPVILREHESRDIQLANADVHYLQEQFASVLELRPTTRRGEWKVKAGAHVGTIVTPGLEFRIRAKAGLTNLFAMLSYAHRLARLRRELIQQDEFEDVREFLIAILVGHLEDLVVGGLRRGYVERTDRLGVLRGRLLLDAQLRRSPGDPTLVCRYEEYTADLPLNQVIRHTLNQIGPSGSQDLDRPLRRLRPAFSHVSAKRFGGRDLDGFVYDRLNAHYEPIHGLCRIILEGRGAEDDQGALPMGSFLVNMNVLFEKFVETWLERHLPRPWQIRGQKRTPFDKRSVLRMFPDLLLYHDDDLRLVADTKYKLCAGVPSNEDAYQMLAYCRALKLRNGVLLYPDLTEPHSRLVVADAENELITDGIDLREPWPEVEQQMGRLMTRLLQLGAPLATPHPTAVYG